jgi:trehalose 6-phosphate synthase/phosphatase
MLPYRSEILKSMICCELIGFHIFEYARNFSTACNRILGHKYEFKKGGNLYIEANGRSILLRVSHVGVDISSIKSIF